MSVDIGRRVFVGSVVTGLPWLVRGSGIAVGAAALTAGLPINAHGQRRPVESEDPVIQEIQRLAKQATEKMRIRPGEGTRQIATALRLRAAHGKAMKLDTQVAQALRRAIRTHGRQALLQAQPDPDAFRAEMSAAGFLNATLPVVDVAEREKLLNALLSPVGYTGVLTAAAIQLEAQAEQLDRSFGTVVPATGDGPTILLRRVQSEAERYCPILRNQLQHLNFLQVLWCSPLLIWSQAVIFLAECVFLAGALASTYGQLYFWGCPA
jgi:hypothetical protein